MVINRCAGSNIIMQNSIQRDKSSAVTVSKTEQIGDIALNCYWRYDVRQNRVRRYERHLRHAKSLREAVRRRGRDSNSE